MCKAPENEQNNRPEPSQSTIKYTILVGLAQLPLRLGSEMTTEEHLKSARSFLAEAREQLREYEKSNDELALGQACEKGWGAVAQALMHAAGKPIESHREFWLIASEVLRKTGNRSLLAGESAGEYLHSAGFYHGLPTSGTSLEQSGSC
jgi:hypothetical protein